MTIHKRKVMSKTQIPPISLIPTKHHYLTEHLCDVSLE